MRFRKSDGSERALAVVLDEARRLTPPEPDWSALDVKLQKAIETPAPAPGAQGRSRLTLAWLPMAAVLALLAVLATPRSGARLPLPAATAQAPDRLRNGDALSTEELIAAESSPIELVHAGRARWTLEANSRALVLEHGDIVRVRLLAGALKAEVVASPRPERFVVEAGGTRIAVHGTVFRVQLRGEQTLVDVEQGVVSVGPRERPELRTALLTAPMHGAFTLEGSAVSTQKSVGTAARRARGRHPSPPPAGGALPTEAQLAEQPDAAELVEPEAAAPASERHPLTIGEAEAGVATVVDAVTRCFKEHTEGSREVRISARTELTIDVSPEGAVTELSFAPPLSPLVQSCSQREALAVEFAPSSEGARLTRLLELAR